MQITCFKYARLLDCIAVRMVLCIALNCFELKLGNLFYECDDTLYWINTHIYISLHLFSHRCQKVLYFLISVQFAPTKPISSSQCPAFSSQVPVSVPCLFVSSCSLCSSVSSLFVSSFSLCSSVSSLFVSSSNLCSSMSSLFLSSSSLCFSMSNLSCSMSRKPITSDPYPLMLL